MDESLFIVLCLFSLAVSLVTIALLVPIYGKVFYSKHSVEYRPIEEIVKIRQGLGMETPNPIDEAEEDAKAKVAQLFGRPAEPMDPLSFFKPERRFQEKRPTTGNEPEGEAPAYTDRDRHLS